MNNHGASEALAKVHVGVCKIYDRDTWFETNLPEENCTFVLGENDILIDSGVSGLGRNEVENFLHLRAKNQ